MWANRTLQVSAMTYLVDSYGPRFGASAVSANGLSRYLFGGAFPLFAIQSEFSYASCQSPY